MTDKPSHGTVSSPVRQRWFESLLIRDFRILLGSTFAVSASNMMELVVLGWLINDITHSVGSVALGGFLRMGPVLPMSLVAGTLADRFNRRKILIWNQLGSIATIGIMAFLIISGSLELWQIYVMAPIRGVFFALEQPVRRTLVMDLAGQERITNALSLDATILMVASISGPFAGGFLIDALGPGSSYILMLGLYAFGLGLLFRLRTPDNTMTPGNESILRNIAEGLRYALTHPVILPAFAITLFMNLLVFPFRAMLPVFQTDVYRVDATGLGLLNSIIGIGAFIGALSLAALSNRFLKGHVYIVGSLVMGILLILFSLSASFYLSLLLLFIHGFGFAGFHVMQGTIPLSVADEDKRGRVMGSMQLAIGAGPFGILLVGALASAWGVQMAVAVMASTLIIIMVAITVGFPKLRRV